MFFPGQLSQEQRLLLHACCAPCAGAVVERLLEEGVRPVVFYSNANIWPEAEYRLRRDECARYARAMGVDFVEDGYDHADWERAVRGLEGEPERGRRCGVCFRYRLARAARHAAENGFGVLASTLASSRWKSQVQVDAAGREACGGTLVQWWARNWRAGGLQERRTQIIREQGFYNQRYCGCPYSLPEGEKDSCAWGANGKNNDIGGQCKTH